MENNISQNLQLIKKTEKLKKDVSKLKVDILFLKKAINEISQAKESKIHADELSKTEEMLNQIDQ